MEKHSASPSRPSAQSGNIFIYIIGAIFLIGLLIVALKGSFQEGTGIDAEQVALQVGEVQRYGAELERGVAYILQNGYSETNIRFAHPNAPSAYGLITDVPARQVFAAEGGGVSWRDPPAGSQVSNERWYITSMNAIYDVGTTCGTDACTDLMIILPDVTKEFCLQVNNANGIDNPGGNPPAENAGGGFRATDGGGNLVFTGSYTYSAAVNTAFGRPVPELCLEGGAGSAHLGLVGHYYYYRVLLAR